jgi:capsular exopolysaccharide synthesis family protein
MQIAAGHPGGGGLAQAGGPVAAQQGAGEIWRVIRGHIWMILIVTCIIAPVAGYVANFFLMKYYPKYTAAGYIQVQPQVQASKLVNSDTPMADPANTAMEIRTQAHILRSEALLTKVLQNMNNEIRKTQWFAQFNGNIPRAKADFEDSLTVTPMQDTKLVKIEFTYSKPDDCKTMVLDLVNTHLENQKQVQTEFLLDRTSMLNNVKIKTDARLKDLRAEMREKQIKVNTDGGGIGRIGAKEMELSKLVAEQVDAQLMYGKAYSAFESTKAAVQSGQDPPMMEQYVHELAPFLVNDEYQLRQIELERDIAAETGTESTRYKQLAKRADIMRANYQQALDAARVRAKVAIIENMQQDMNKAATKLESLTKRVDFLKADLGELSNSLVAYFSLQQEEKGLMEQLKTVKDNIENVMALQSARAAEIVKWNTLPETPTNRSFPKLPIVMSLAVFLGLLLSLSVAFLREAMDQSIRSPRDIAKIGQISLLGLIPDENDDPQSSGARLPVVIFDAPHSIMAESFRHIRTKLQHTASLDTTRSIMVTSPSPGDGKTTIACNLAAGLALNGRRILLVDANFRRPEVHKIFGLSNEQGFSDVLNAVAAFDEVIQETQVPNLAVMSSGPKPMNPTELFESQLLIDFIERALEEFDHVIFDSGPIMVVAEAQAMAPRVDGVISVVRAKSNNRGLLQRMRDELRRNKAEHLGVVLNAVRAQGGGYYRRNIQTYYDYANNG